MKSRGQTVELLEKINEAQKVIANLQDVIDGYDRQKNLVMESRDLWIEKLHKLEDEFEHEC